MMRSGLDTAKELYCMHDKAKEEVSFTFPTTVPRSKEIWDELYCMHVQKSRK